MLRFSGSLKMFVTVEARDPRNGFNGFLPHPTGGNIRAPSIAPRWQKVGIDFAGDQSDGCVWLA